MKDLTLLFIIMVVKNKQDIRDSLVARMSACRADDRGSIPRRGALLFCFSFLGHL